MENEEPYNWYIVHTTYPNELKVKDILDIAGIENYIPTKHITLLWNGEEVTKEVAVIPTCLFIRIQPSDFAMVQYMREISFFTNNSGEVEPIPDQYLEEIRRMAERSEDPSSYIMNLLTAN